MFSFHKHYLDMNTSGAFQRKRKRGMVTPHFERFRHLRLNFCLQKQQTNKQTKINKPQTFQPTKGKTIPISKAKKKETSLSSFNVAPQDCLCYSIFLLLLLFFSPVKVLVEIGDSLRNKCDGQSV